MVSRRDLLKSAGVLGGAMALESTPVTAAQPAPTLPFPGARVPIESQGWWQPQSGHVHLSVAAPVGQVVSGILPLDVRLTLHNSDVTLDLFTIRILQNATGPYEFRFPLSLTATQPIQAWDARINLDTRWFKDGWRVCRLSVRGTGPINELATNLGFPMYVQNAQAQASPDPHLLPTATNSIQSLTGMEGWGWPGANGFNYQQVFWESVPRQPVAGMFRPRVKCNASTVCRLIVERDTTHEIPATPLWPYQPMTHGATLVDVSGDMRNWLEVPIDTTQLTNGWHWLTARHERTSNVGPGGDIASGVAKFWFCVDNAHGPRPPFTVAY